MREQWPVEKIIADKEALQAFATLRDSIGTSLCQCKRSQKRHEFWQLFDLSEYVRLALTLWNNWGEYYFFVEELIYDVLEAPDQLGEIYQKLYTAKFPADDTEWPNG